jgi:hypothetical protein
LNITNFLLFFFLFLKRGITSSRVVKLPMPKSQSWSFPAEAADEAVLNKIHKNAGPKMALKFTGIYFGYMVAGTFQDG